MWQRRRLFYEKKQVERVSRQQHEEGQHQTQKRFLGLIIFSAGCFLLVFTLVHTTKSSVVFIWNGADFANHFQATDTRIKHPNQDQLVWFLHFHKAAGSSFTELAWWNEETVRTSLVDHTALRDRHGHLELIVVGPKTKTMLRWDLVAENLAAITTSNEWCDERIDNAISIAKRMNRRPMNASTSIEETDQSLLENAIDHLRQKEVTFVSTEHWFPKRKDLRQQSLQEKLQRNGVRFVTMMRHPIERILSSFRFHARAKDSRSHGGYRCKLQSKQCFLAEFAHAESNMHIKMFNGIPFGPLVVLPTNPTCANLLFTTANVTERMYQDARKSLESMDVVLTVESLRTAPSKVACVLQKELGWTNTTIPLKNAGPAKNQTIDDLVGNDSDIEEILAQIQSDNLWDLKLYDVAKKLEQDMFHRLGCT